MIIVVDSGSTKADWCIAADGKALCCVTTQGISPIHLSDQAIRNIISTQLLSNTEFEEFLKQGANNSNIQAYFYGSGCIKEMIQPLTSILEAAFENYNVHFNVYNDLLGAARASCGIAPGIVCILGTGANSCLYDGNEIIQNTPPLGYILGDEGSGAVLGKQFLNGIFKGWLDDRLKEEFLEWSGLKYHEIIDKVYRQPQPNRFLASIVPFISQHVLRNHALEDMVINNFREFLRLNVHPYCRPDLPLFFVGGVANAFAVQLFKAVESESLLFGKIITRPINSLIKYHNL